jgi:uncharacterized protein YjiS (DUF1127 family)
MHAKFACLILAWLGTRRGQKSPFCGATGGPTARTGADMKPFKMISAKLSAWRRYRETVRELSQFSDHELSDIGIRRSEIDDIARRPLPAEPAGDRGC